MRSLSAEKTRLVRLERWFQSRVVGPHEDGASGRDAKALILPSKHLAPEERLEVYSGMYFLRLLDCLAEDYPAVRTLAGPPAFEKLVRAYLKRFPSRHYSLNALGSNLPRFLDGPARIARRPLLADVARVERAISESFDAEVSPMLSPADLAMIPPAAWESGRIRLTESLRLLELSHRANAIVTACRQEKPLPPLGRARTWVAVYRKEWTVWRMDLTEPMHAVLAALRDGRALSRALAAGAEAFAGKTEDLQAEVHRWFREWATEGLFAAVER